MGHSALDAWMDNFFVHGRNRGGAAFVFQSAVDVEQMIPHSVGYVNLCRVSRFRKSMLMHTKMFETLYGCTSQRFRYFCLASFPKAWDTVGLSTQKPQIQDRDEALAGVGLFRGRPMARRGGD